MKNKYVNFYKNIYFIFVFFISIFIGQNAISQITPQKINFWDHTQKGANIFNQKVTREDIRAAKKYGMTFIRLAPDKFASKKRDFLIGDADSYTGLVQQDLAELKNLLDMCAEEKMPVILSMLSLPGSRWKQNNHEKDDLRLWKQVKFQEQTAKFWQDLAISLKGHPAIVGYNILNEPHLEKLYTSRGNELYKINQKEVQQKLYNFYDFIIKKIREIDKGTPIVLDSSAYGDPKTFKELKIHKDDKVLYSFHMYEPYTYTNFKSNKGKYKYPGKIQQTYWDKERLKNYIQEVVNFQQKNKIPSHRILVGEFGGHRASEGLENYFQDLIEIFKENDWHFAFYAFREDEWDGMDYELGNKKLPANYWNALEKGEFPHLERDSNHPPFKAILNALSGS